MRISGRLRDTISARNRAWPDVHWPRRFGHPKTMPRICPDGSGNAITLIVHIVGWLRGLEATYTEHDCSLSEGGLENRCTGNRTVGSNPTRQSHKERMV